MRIDPNKMTVWYYPSIDKLVLKYAEWFYHDWNHMDGFTVWNLPTDRVYIGEFDEETD